MIATETSQRQVAYKGRGHGDALFILPLGEEDGASVAFSPTFDGLPTVDDGSLAVAEGHPLDERRVCGTAEYFVNVEGELGAAV
jgi:hypothetical protein